MDEQDNGEPKTYPTLLIAFDQESQQVGIKFDSSQFKTWDFVLGVLEMAKLHAQAQKINAQLMQAQQAQAQAQQAQQLARQLSRERG